MEVTYTSSHKPTYRKPNMTKKKNPLRKYKMSGFNQKQNFKRIANNLFYSITW